MWVLGNNDTMKLLEKSPKIAPLLARLYDHRNLYHLAKSDEAERLGLTEVMVDMLALDLQPAEGELVTDVLLEIMRQAEKDLRASLAVRLAAMEGVPLRMVLHLANDEIEIAEPILRYSPVLTEMDLVYIIKSHQAGHWRAIAQRSRIGVQAINALADTGDLQTAQTLAGNTEITLTDYAMGLFVPLAGESEELARPLLARPELPKSIAAKLYEAVGEQLKQEIKARFQDEAAHSMAAAIDTAIEQIDEIVEEANNIAAENYLPSSALIRAAYIAKEKGQIDSATMLSSLKRGQLLSFVAQFSAHVEIDPQVTINMMMQKTGQSLAVACKATGIRKPDFMSFYMMTHSVRKAFQPVIDNQHLMRAVRTYDEITPEDALKLLRHSQSVH